MADSLEKRGLSILSTMKNGLFLALLRGQQLQLAVEIDGEAPPGDDLRVGIVDDAALQRELLTIDALGTRGHADDLAVFCRAPICNRLVHAKR